MRPTAALFVFLIACLAAGTLLAYPVALSGLSDAPPHRIATRLTQFIILLGIWPVLRAFGVANRSALGLAPPWGTTSRTVARGWVLGVGILAALSLSLYGLGVRVPDPRSPTDLHRVLVTGVEALGAGLLIGLLEEVFFRGAVFSAARRQGSAAGAMLWSSLLYALLHFLKPQAVDAAQPMDWSLSWTLFAGTFDGLAGVQQPDSLLALFLAGMLLGAIREHTGHIAYCIGIHAGWVFVIRLTRLFTDGNDASPYAFLAGDYDGVIGYLAALWLGLLLAAGWVALRWRDRRPESRTDPR